MEEGNPRYGYFILLPILCSLPCVHLHHHNEECTVTYRPMLCSQSIRNQYQVIPIVIVVVDIMMIPLVVQKGLMLRKLFRRWHNKNVDLSTRWVIIHLGQGKVHVHDHLHIVCISPWKGEFSKVPCRSSTSRMVMLMKCKIISSPGI